ncbi:MAG TPA: tetratricopeptide repeat protein [Steroidobacteraceae bacterium]|jgi:DNA-binding winged helix-turn-helix (wHTH) protein/tetratricopeptide (TPR) repeat protein|nr:tetratricopeptide repeat protein [Steroidobacteraceae bacterium]
MTDTELQFDGWTVNRVSGEITREGRGSRLPQQPLRILLELADHAGAIVTREQLVKVLWPGGIVDFDNGLNVAVRKLRVALDDVGDSPRYIETLPRVGYRFIGKPGPGEPMPSRTRALTPRTRLALALTVAALGAAIAGTWWWTAPRATHTPSVRALELYLEGIHERSRRDINANVIAAGKFEAALKEDPNYPQAWAALGEVYSSSVIRQMMPRDEGVSKARAAALRAIALDDGAVEGHALLGEILLDHDRNFAAADKEFKRALEINDRSARLWHHIAMWHAHQGHVEEALAAVRRSREIEPMTLLYSGNYALILYNARRYDEAIEFLKPLVAGNPGFGQARSVLARAMMTTGDLAGAEEQLRQVADPGVNQSDLGLLYAKSGRRDDALHEIDRLEAHGREGYGVAYEEAVIYAALGELDRGCEALTRAVDDHSVILSWMRLDPRVDALRGRQCFADVEQRVYQ